MKNFELFEQKPSQSPTKSHRDTVSLDIGSGLSNRKFTHLEEPIEDYSDSRQYSADGLRLQTCCPMSNV